MLNIVDKKTVVVIFLSTWHMLDVYERKEPQLRKYFHKIQLEGILLIDD